MNQLDDLLFRRAFILWDGLICLVSWNLFKDLLDDHDSGDRVAPDLCFDALEQGVLPQVQGTWFQPQANLTEIPFQRFVIDREIVFLKKLIEVTDHRSVCLLCAKA